MSGFLHRLAAQAMGNKESTLRSLARLPYATPSLPVHNEEAGRKAATLGTMGNKRRPVANSGAELDHVHGQIQPRDSFHAEIDAQDRENEVIPLLPEVLIAESATEFIIKPDCENEVIPSSPEVEVLIGQSATGFTTKPDLEIAHPSQPSSVKSRLRQPETSEKKTTSGESSDWDEVNKTHGTLNNFATNPIANEGPYATLNDSSTPPPLLPLQNTEHPSALNPGAVTQRGEPRGAMWQSQVEETTEVHVSIGRIEVTAVHETPPPKRQVPAAAKPMTLDEYLARRQRQA